MTAAELDNASTENGSGGELPKALKRKLATLSYPDLETVGLEGNKYQKVVLWLEEEKIRLYEKIDRRTLRDFADEAWYKHVIRYGRELGLNVSDGMDDKATTAKLQLLNCLANLALSDVYRDNVETKDIDLAAAEAVAGETGKPVLGDLAPTLNRILEHFKLPQLNNPIDTETVAALQCIKTRLSKPSSAGANLNLEEIPSGLDANPDPTVRRAVAVLRLLHSIEMAQCQINVNHVLNDLQELTANPKTDASLGKVGT